MENAFRKVVEQIFSNWTALKLAIEYSDAAFKSKETVGEFINFTVQYCLYTSNVDVSDIEEALDDIMDQELDTVCEDGSTKEIASLLYKFLMLIKQEDLVKLEEEYSKLPVTSTLSHSSEQKPTEKIHTVSVEQGPEVAECTSTSMDLDSEWTEVKSRRRH